MVISELAGTWDKDKLSLSGKFEIKGRAAEQLKLSGSLNGNTVTFSVQNPAPDSLGAALRAKAQCYSEDKSCSDYYVEFIVEDKGIYYYEQAIPSKKVIPGATSTTTTTTSTTLKNIVEEESIPDEVPDASPGEFSGSSDEDILQMFVTPGAKGSPTTTTTTLPTRKGDVSIIKGSEGPRDQAIQYADAGRLVNPTDFLKLSSDPKANFRIFTPAQKRYFGTFLMAEIVQKISQFANKILPGYKMAISALSDFNGGKLPPHASHRNGTDADISYLVNDPSAEFQSLVTRTGVGPHMLVKENWQLFKTAFKTNQVRMIFVDPRIKKALCQEAIRVGDLKNSSDRGEAFETLRWIRPLAKHDNHFHMRVRCGPGHPLCQEHNYSYMDTGCF